MTSNDVDAESTVETFRSFIAEVEPRLKRALVAALGVDRGLEATAEAVAYGWEHWNELQEMDNPAGYLYRVGRSRARLRNGPVVLPAPAPAGSPWVEPGLPSALASLSEAQRAAVLLVYTFGHSMADAAEVLGVSKSTVQTQVERGLRRLRSELGVKS